jgi:3-methyladenine DNA glycosylase AlkC
MEPFKLLLNRQTIAQAGHHLQRAWTAFDRLRFEALALEGLDALELKARAAHIAAALDATLPDDFEQAAQILEATLARPRPADEGTAKRADADDGLSGWAIWPMTMWVAQHGLATPERALAALHAMTQRFTAEWAVRPFIERHPELCWPLLQRWALDPSEHVRRLVSEGTRPRLPWGLQLKGLIADPSPTLPLLRQLQDDPSDYVRRSVANHLNDIAKDHPSRVADWVAEHLPGATPQRKALLRRACRTLIKQGDARILTLWGVGEHFDGTLALAVSPGQIRLGESVQIALTLKASSTRPQTLVIDYAVHHVKANGQAAAKVFKGWSIQLAPGDQRSFTRRHAIRPITTRRYYPCRHLVDLRINGVVLAQGAFELTMA